MDLPPGFQPLRRSSLRKRITTTVALVLGAVILWFLWQIGIIGPDPCETIEERCSKAGSSVYGPDEMRACAAVYNTFAELRAKGEQITGLKCRGMISALDGAREGRINEYLVQRPEPPPRPAAPGWNDEPPAPRPEPLGAAASHCGHADAAIAAAPPVAWSSWLCLTREAAGPRWPSCLPRKAYTQDPARGCPGEERCCPAEQG